MRIIAVSPHLDDAVLCAGGTLHQAATTGHMVTVATLFTADPPPAGLSPYAHGFHDACGLGVHAVAHRRAEDAAACRELGVKYMWSGLPEAIYRITVDGLRYANRAALFGPPLASDTLPELEHVLAEALVRADVVLLPLGVGGHVDHVLTRAWGERIVPRSARLCYYEESLYNDQLGPRAWATVTVRGLFRRTTTLPIDAAQHKLAAVDRYVSQLRMLGVSEPGQLRRSFRARCRTEAFWTPR